MTNGEGGSRSRRSRLLRFVFAGLAGLAAFGTVVLYWLLRQPRVRVPDGPVDQPVTTGDPVQPTAPVQGPERGVAPPESAGSCDVTCDDSCSNSCDSAVGSVCDDLVKEACEQPMNDACVDLDGCDPSLSCESSARLGQFLSTVTGGQPWLAVATAPPRLRVTLPARLGIAIIRGYQRYVSHALGTACRYSPSCSEYGVDALRKFGALDGSVLTVARIRRCTVAVPHGTLDPA